MRATLRIWTAALMTALAWQLAAGSAFAVDPDVACQASLLKATGKYASCRLSEDSKAAKKLLAPDYSKCTSKFHTSWGNALGKGLDACSEFRNSASDTWFEGAVDDTTGRIAEALAIGGASTDENLPYCKLPASGQVTSYTPGDDGDVQAGSKAPYISAPTGVKTAGTTYAVESPTPVIDTRTGLMWEVKNNDGGPRDVDSIYYWDPTPTPNIWQHVAKLNNVCSHDDMIDCSANGDADCGGIGVCGYGGYRDWRVPNVKELMSIVNYEIPFPGPVVDDVFHSALACGSPCASCSCTAS